MQALRNLWESFMGFIMRTLLASFLMGLLIALTVSYLHWSIGRTLVPPNIPLSRKGKLVLALALLLLALNAFLAWRTNGQRLEEVSAMARYCRSHHCPR